MADLSEDTGLASSSKSGSEDADSLVKYQEVLLSYVDDGFSKATEVPSDKMLTSFLKISIPSKPDFEISDDIANHHAKIIAPITKELFKTKPQTYL